MTVNGHRPTPAEVAASFAEAGVPDVREPDPLLIAEQAVVGAAIQSTEAAAEALGILRPEQFSRNAHRAVMEAVERLAEAGVPVEPTSVMSELASSGMLARLHGPDMGSGGVYLHSLTQHAGDIGYHARIVLGAWKISDTELALDRCKQIAANTALSVDERLDLIRQRIEDATAYAGPSPLRPNSDAVFEVLNELEDGAEPGLATGYTDLDLILGGLRPKTLVVIGARPGQGKSLIALNIADHVGTRLGLPVLFASLEMTEAELTQRRIAATAKVSLHSIVQHQLSDGDWDRLGRVQDRLAETSLFIDDTSSQSPAHIRGRLRAMARAGHPARLLVIDYLGFMAAPKAESRQQAVAELARAAKTIAREFAIPVILLAQLNRGPENRAEKRPQLSDLRESGEIEQSADVVILLHREDAYVPESPRAGEVDLCISKNRQGPQATVTLAFQGHYGRIVDMARDPDDNWTPSASIGERQ